MVPGGVLMQLIKHPRNLPLILFLLPQLVCLMHVFVAQQSSDQLFPLSSLLHPHALSQPEAETGLEILPVAYHIYLAGLLQKVVLEENQFLVQNISDELEIGKNGRKLDVRRGSPVEVTLPCNIFRFFKDVVDDYLHQDQEDDGGQFQVPVAVHAAELLRDAQHHHLLSREHHVETTKVAIFARLVQQFLEAPLDNNSLHPLSRAFHRQGSQSPCRSHLLPLLLEVVVFKNVQVLSEVVDHCCQQGPQSNCHLLFEQKQVTLHVAFAVLPDKVLSVGPYFVPEGLQERGKEHCQGHHPEPLDESLPPFIAHPLRFALEERPVSKARLAAALGALFGPDSLVLDDGKVDERFFLLLFFLVLFLPGVVVLVLVCQTLGELLIVLRGGFELIFLEPALWQSLLLLLVLIALNAGLLVTVIFIAEVVVMLMLTTPSDKFDIFRFVSCIVQPEILPQLLIFVIILLEVLHLAVLPSLPLLVPNNRLQFFWRVRMLEWNQSEFALGRFFDPDIPER